ncbi:serine/threonine protein kinase [Limnobacter sp.]|uniref:serine/threonine protein kinase n=1 Tax=Limnobacter sp. TaxID=2003368 RepID=UPI0035118752
MSMEPTLMLPKPNLVGDSGQEPLPIGSRLEEFEVQGVIGVGGFGIVYRAMDHQLGRPVALKEYLPATLAMRQKPNRVVVRDPRHQATFAAGLRSFVNEARLLAQFDHPALVKVYRFWETAGTAYMVMPLYQGETLQSVRDNMAEPMPQPMLLEMLLPLTEALEVLHAQQCYHRDVSPENILKLDATGKPLLLDFGAARQAIGGQSQPFTVILKASYAPIEQYAEAPGMAQGPWTDVYALGAVAHYLMLGKAPTSSVARMVHDNCAALADRHDLPYDHHVRAAVDAALAVQASARTQTMMQFRQMLLGPALHTDVLQLYAQAAPAPIQAERATQIDTSPRPHGRLLGRLSRLNITFSVTMALVLAAALGLVPGVFNDNTQTQNTSPSTALEHAPLAEKAGPPPGTSVANSTTAGERYKHQNLPLAFAQAIESADFSMVLQGPTVPLKIGQDLLEFSITSPMAGYVSVFVRSSDGSLIRLLPNARVPTLTVAANSPLHLPPSEEPIMAAGPSGANTVLVLVTEQERNVRALALQDHYGFGLVTANAPLAGESPCHSQTCSDRMAAGWFGVEEIE